MATKILEGMRNGVIDMTNEEFMNNQPKVKELLEKIPVAIEKYKKFDKTP